jgi:hypothetical protein
LAFELDQHDDRFTCRQGRGEIGVYFDPEQDVDALKATIRAVWDEITAGSQP